MNGVLTRYVYDGDDILLEYDGANALQARYGHGIEVDQPLAIERGGQNHYIHTDHLGTVRSVTAAAGAAANSYDTDSFGRFELRSESVPQPYAFTAREYDSESGLHYYRARYYSAAMGRFIAEDPIDFISGQTNLYSCVSNGSINYKDPSGLLISYGGFSCFGAASGSAIGGFFGAIVGATIGAIAVAVAEPDLSADIPYAIAAAGTLAGAAVGFDLALGAASCGKGNQIEDLTEVTFRDALLNGPEFVMGFDIYGNKGRVGSAFNRNIFLIEAKKKSLAKFRRLVAELEREARQSGAKYLNIVGTAVKNEQFMNPAIASIF